MFTRKLLFSTFNLATRLYSSKLITRNPTQVLFKHNPVCNTYTPLFKMSCAVNFVTFEEVKALKDDKSVLLIDVREPSELKETGVIPGSINIPLGQVENILKNISKEEFGKTYNRPKPEHDFPLVFSCRSGKRSTTAAETAVKLGYSNVRNYTGGWLDWEKNIKQ